jgi:predicted PurR-regulated permease PerM
VLEPTVFGASLNMTPLSILAALVMWGSVWGLPGAVLSVPMLGIQKISMNYTVRMMIFWIEIRYSRGCPLLWCCVSHLTLCYCSV